MTDIKAHDLANRAAAAGMTIDEMCARAGIMRATFDAWRSETMPTPAAVVASLLRVVENAERGGERPNVPVAQAARVAEIMRCKEILGWGMPALALKLGIPLPQALKIGTGKIDVADGDIDYMQRLCAAIEAVPRTRPMSAPADTESTEDDDMRLREAVIEQAIAVYTEVEGDGDDAAGARWAIGQLLGRLGMLGDARARLPAAGEGSQLSGNSGQVESMPDDGVIGRVPFHSQAAPATA